MALARLRGVGELHEVGESKYSRDACALIFDARETKQEHSPWKGQGWEFKHNYAWQSFLRKGHLTKTHRPLDPG